MDKPTSLKCMSNQWVYFFLRNIPFRIMTGHRIKDLMKGPTCKTRHLPATSFTSTWSTCGVRSMNVFKCLPVLSGVSSCAIFTILKDIQDIFKRQSISVFTRIWLVQIINNIHLIADWHYMVTIPWLSMSNLIGEFWLMKFLTRFTFLKCSAWLCGQLTTIFITPGASLLFQSFPLL